MTKCDAESSWPAFAEGEDAVALEISVGREGDSTVLKLRGELDLATAEDLQREIRLAMARHDQHPLVLDLAELSFTDSSGLSVIVQAHHLLADQGRQLHLRAPGRQVVRALSVTGLYDRLHVI